jgi:chromosome segregation ATPase
MLSGIQVLSTIDEAFGRLQRETNSADRTLADLNNRLLRLSQEESEAYHTLARIRLAAGAKDKLITRLVAVDENVRAALASRSQETETIDRVIEAIEAELDEARRRREEAVRVAVSRQEALATGEETARQRLIATPAYQAQAAAAAEAETVAEGAAAKVEQAEADRIEKGKPYESDDLFQYLWRRRFGTAEYEGGALARLFDRRVANLIGYDKARADYALLQEIPRRLALHAERQRARADAEAQALATLQQAALAADELAAGRAALAEAEAAVDAVDDAIEAIEKKLGEALARRARLVRGEDPVMQRALAVTEEALRHEDIAALMAVATATAISEDDAAVRRLGEIETEKRQLAIATRQAEKDQAESRARLAEVEEVRRDYRQRGYNRGVFDAASGAFIGSLLAELLAGALNRDRFWDKLGRHQQPRPPAAGGGWGRPDFGGGGFGRQRGGSWGGGSGSSGGDFRTGGGF